MKPTGKTIARTAFHLAAALFLVVGALIAWPEADAKLLVPPDGWEVNGGFVVTRPDTNEVRASVLNNRQARYWRSWDPQSGSQPGKVRSKPFKANGQIVVPYNGFAGDADIATYLECIGNGEKLYLATGRNNTQWSEVFLDPAHGWCGGDMRVVAESSSTQNYVSIGTPFQVTRLSTFKQSTLAALWFLVLAWATIAGCFLAITQYVSRKNWGIDPVAAGLIGVGLIGYLQFFIFWSAPNLGDALAFALVLFGLYATTRHLLARINRVSSAQRMLPDISQAPGLWILVGATLLTLSLIVDAGTGPWSMNGRFTPVRWSSDNQIPSIVSDILVSGKHNAVSSMLPWTIADRPPLSYGWHASLQAVLVHFTHGNDGGHIGYLYQLATGVVLNTSWVALVCLLLARLAISRLSCIAIILVAVLSPLFLFNSLYIWPKLLSGTFTLMAAWMLLGIDRPGTQIREDNRALITAAILSAMGLLTHGGSAFGIISILILATLYRGLPSLKGGLAAASIAIVLLLPWSLWQSGVAPPGNALIKAAFAGTFGFGEEKMSVVDTLMRSYQGIGLDNWLEKKRDAVLTLMFGLRNTCGLGEMGASHSLIDRWRGSDFYYVVPSLNFLLFGFFAVLAGAIKRSQDDVTRAARKLVLFGVTTLALSALITWDCHINHHQSYQALMALQLGLMVALASSGRAGWFLLGANILYGMVVWVIEPLNHFPRFDYVATILFAVCLLAWIVTLRSARTSGMVSTV